MVEFALVIAIFLVLVLGILEFGRLFFYLNSMAEATRLGARIAVVCSIGEANIKTRMQEIVPFIPAGNIDVSYNPIGCTASTCQTVTVTITPGVTFDPLVPFLAGTVPLNGFSTTLPRESLDSSGGNPTCQAPT